eukprot:jgi/Picre1/35293/NNA_002755.t1
MTPLKNNWLALYKPVTENLKLDMRMNLKSRKVEIKTTDKTVDAGNLQRAADFIHAFILGFEVNDAIALLRLDDLYIESFEVKDVKTLRGEHLARGIGVWLVRVERQSLPLRIHQGPVLSLLTLKFIFWDHSRISVWQEMPYVT